MIETWLFDMAWFHKKHAKPRITLIFSINKRVSDIFSIHSVIANRDSISAFKTALKTNLFLKHNMAELSSLSVLLRSATSVVNIK